MEQHFTNFILYVRQNIKAVQWLQMAASLVCLGLSVSFVINPMDWIALFMLIACMDVILFSTIIVWSKVFDFQSMDFTPEKPWLFRAFNIFSGLLVGHILFHIVKVILSITENF